MENRYELQMELNEVYEELASIAVRQAALTRERDRVESDRDAILKELGKLGTYDVT